MQISEEIITSFLEGENDMKYVVSVEPTQTRDFVYIIRDDPAKGRMVDKLQYHAFIWFKPLDPEKFYKGNKEQVKRKMKEHGITIELLKTAGNQRLRDGFTYIAHSSKSYKDLIDFFKFGGFNPYNHKDHFIRVSQTEQFLIQSGIRLFKGYEELSELNKLVFDIETEGLNMGKDAIFAVGMKSTKGREEVISADEVEDANDRERQIIYDFFRVLKEMDPAVIAGYNSANFDWEFIFKRAELLGIDTKSLLMIDGCPYEESFKFKDSTLKLGQDTEEYRQLNIWSKNVVDTIHSVRRAQAQNSDIKKSSLKYIAKFSKVAKPHRVYIDGKRLGHMWKNQEEEYIYNRDTGDYELLKEDTIIPLGYDIVKGRELVKKYLLDDLWETNEVDNIFSQSAFMLTKLVASDYQRIFTAGTAALWKLILFAWSYKHKLAIPSYDKKRDFTGGLSRLFRVGFNQNILKLDFGSLYPSIMLTYMVFPECDVTGVWHKLLEYFFNTRNKSKKLMKAAKKAGDHKMAGAYDRKQLPIKIFNNSAFGSISAAELFPWADIDKGELITCTGRQWIRFMVRYFMSKGFQPLVLDTDGANFTIPEEIKEYKYISTGAHYNNEAGKEYTGIDAVLAEYNDKYMKGVMSLSLDGFGKATINLMKKNYINLEDDGEIKLVGNTVKSKALPAYIDEFFYNSLKLLLNNKGREFVDYYYDYIEKIYNKAIPLSKIASKSRVKKTLEEYQSRGNNKAGKPLPKQAHMERALENNLNIKLGDVIYYVNNGTAASHGDIQYSYYVPESEIENNPEATGEYNVPGAIRKLNNRIRSLMVVFPENVRKKLLIKKPDEKQWFTDSELQLISGLPLKASNQDRLKEDFFDMEEKEKRFWRKTGLDPDYMFKDVDPEYLEGYWENTIIENEEIEDISYDNSKGETQSTGLCEEPEQDDLAVTGGSSHGIAYP